MHKCMHTVPLQTLKYFQPTTSKEEMYLTNQGDFSRTIFTPLPFLVAKYSVFLHFSTHFLPQKSIWILKESFKNPTKLNSIITRTKYGFKEKKNKKKEALAQLRQE